ncbi:MAG: nitroreductase family protein [Candidatus Bathyarchaeia archaeon]
MELAEAIRNRRSIRAFKEKDIDEETVVKLIEAASWAPSAGNLQPWHFIIVRTSTVKSKLAQSASQSFIEKAPVVIVVCADEKRAKLGYGLRGETLYCIQDTAAATQNILLTAYSLGLGACWVGAFNEEAAKKAINAPKEIRPVAIIPVGYPAEQPAPRSRKPISQIIRNEGF